MTILPDTKPLIYVVYNRRTRTFREECGTSFMFNLNYFDDIITNKYYKEGDF